MFGTTVLITAGDSGYSDGFPLRPHPPSVKPFNPRVERP